MPKKKDTTAERREKLRDTILDFIDRLEDKHKVDIRFNIDGINFECCTCEGIDFLLGCTCTCHIDTMKKKPKKGGKKC
jgi:hypothetical protein